MRTILINASGLHVGGGVQVAVSFLSELSKKLPDLSQRYPDIEFHLLVSSHVHSELCSLIEPHNISWNYRVINIQGLKGISPKYSKEFRAYDLVFTVFGPCYIFPPIPKHIVGFAMPWIIYPNNEVMRRYSILKRYKSLFFGWVRWQFFKHSEHLIVEMEHVRDEIVSKKKISFDQISVVYNCVSSVYRAKDKCQHLLKFPQLNNSLVKLGILSRNYPHKNIKLLPEVGKVLKRKFNMEVRFFITFSAEEWKSTDSLFQKFVTNVGAVRINDGPSFYEQIDGVIFPSLLECFSATPLEAMTMRKPLFASDRRFVRDCCGEHAIYFDPLSPESAADAIADWYLIKTKEEQTRHINAAYNHVTGMPNAEDRCQKYIDILVSKLNKNGDIQLKDL